MLQLDQISGVVGSFKFATHHNICLNSKLCSGRTFIRVSNSPRREKSRHCSNYNKF